MNPMVQSVKRRIFHKPMASDDRAVILTSRGSVISVGHLSRRHCLHVEMASPQAVSRDNFEILGLENCSFPEDPWLPGIFIHMNG